MSLCVCFWILAAGLVATSACRRDEKIKLEATDESQPLLAATVHAADPKTSIQLIKGFHGIEQNAWRWTMGRFAVTLQPPPGSSERGASLVVKLSVPEAVMQHIKQTSLSASIAQTPIGSETYTAAGERTFRAEVPAALMKSDAVTVEFTIEPFLPAGTLDTRELGIVFVSASLDSK